MAVTVAALYRFTRFADCPALQRSLAAACERHGVKGTLLVAPEGINGTIAGSAAAIGHVLVAIHGLAGCEDLQVKFSSAAAMPFHRMKVRIKAEIVTMGEPRIDPLAAGHRVAPADWNDHIARPGTLLVDTRNAYEVAIGSFAGAVDPGTPSFRDFPAWVRANRAELAGAAQVAMFCTGGIRCEKASALLKAEGVGAVYHLDGGILKYLETTAPEASRWQGECFVFDERVAVSHGLAPGTHALCRACRMPVSAAARASPLYAEGTSCPACHANRNDAQRAGYAERHRQAALAEARGEVHVGQSLRREGADTASPRFTESR
jgi:UPF0176 protein